MYIYTEGFLEVAIKIWPEWDLNPRPLNSTRTRSQLCIACPISSFVQFSDFILVIAFVYTQVYFNQTFAQVGT